MTRLGEKLRASAVGLLVARTAEAERQRDDARGAKDQALSQLAAVREAHEIGERARAKDREVADRTADLIAEVGAWVASVTGELPSPEVRLVDAVHRAAVVNAATLRREQGDAAGEAMVELSHQVAAARAVLAPDVSTDGTPLDEVARTALRSARATATADELRWWSRRPGSHLHESLAARALQLDPSGTVPEGDQPPTPTIFRADDEPRVPRRAAAGLAANLAAAARRTAQQCDAKAGHPDEVLVALRVADEVGPAQPGLGGVLKERGDALRILARAVRAYVEQPDDVVDATIGCGQRIAGRVCRLSEHHQGKHVPSWTVLDSEQVAREAARVAVVNGGVETDHHADDVVDALARAGFVPGVYPPGMAIDGDMLRTLITDALPRWATDEFAGELADSVLDAAVRAGFTILHGTDLTPRPPVEPEQHWAEQAIERAREYLASLGHRRIVDDHGEDLAAMLREIGVAADTNSTRLNEPGVDDAPDEQVRAAARPELTRTIPCGAAVPWVDNSACTLPAGHVGEHVEVPF